MLAQGLSVCAACMQPVLGCKPEWTTFCCKSWENITTRHSKLVGLSMVGNQQIGATHRSYKAQVIAAELLVILGHGSQLPSQMG